MRVNRNQLMQLIQEELQKAIREGYSTSTLNKRGFVEPDYLDELPPEGEYPEMEWPERSGEEGDLRADTVLSVNIGPRVRDIPDSDSWPVAPGQEAIMQAFNELWDAEYMAKLKKKLSPQDYKEVEADFQRKMMAQARKIAAAQAKAGTVVMDDPPKEKKPLDRFRNLLKRMVSEELESYIQELQEQHLEEVYSDKQRRWACAQANKPAGKRKKSLSKKEADEMCKGPKLKPKSKRKKK